MPAESTATSSTTCKYRVALVVVNSPVPRYHHHHPSPVLHTALDLGFDVATAAHAYDHASTLESPPGIYAARSPHTVVSPVSVTSPVNSKHAFATSPTSSRSYHPHSHSFPPSTSNTNTHQKLQSHLHSSTYSTLTPASSTPASGGLGPLRRPRARKQRYSRSRTGCLTCRARKVKCDENHPVCTRCSDLEIEVS